ncbi:MAG: phosphatase PAP2 family protein [Anaerolineales bacterium]|nr:phosphatase PAP2 family protein [Anaerolineales bacterium]
MDAWFDAGVATSTWLQQNYSGLGQIMSIISALGRFEFYLALVLLVYWNIDKYQGKRLAYLLSVGNFLINTSKHLLRQPRPYWVDHNLQMEATSGYGIPSGHVTSATITYIYLANWIRKQWAWVVAFIIIALMALSRVFLAQHFLHDVAAGVILGSAVLLGYWLWHIYAQDDFREMILGQRFWLATGVPIALGALYVVILFILGEPDLTVSWGDLIELAEFESLEEVVSSVAILIGLGMGFVLEGSRVRYLVEAELWRKIVRYLLGLVVTLAILYGLRAVFATVAPEGSPDWLIMTLRFIRYYLTAVWASLYAPWAFVKIGLASAEPEQPITVSINRLKSDKK